jgi:outer membrane protein OmpA-like peptidoglycan-associated protein
MANIYDELKSLVSKEMTSKVAKELGANATHVTDATHQLIPTLLAKFMSKSDSPQLHSLMEDAGKLNLHHTEHVSCAGGSHHVAMGDKFISTVMGSQGGTLATMVAAKDGMSADHAKKLVSTLGGVMAGFLGNKVAHGGGHQLMEQLRGEKTSILAGIPAEWKDKLNISHDAMHCTPPHHAAAHKATAAHTTHHAAPHHAATPTPPKKKGGLGWLLWLLLAILVILLLWWLLGKGCTHKKVNVVTPVVETVIPVVETTAANVAATASNVYDLALADGQKLAVTKGSHVDELVTFLRSDKYKNADDAYLKTHWFEFDDIDFVYNSSTEFVEGSVDNIRNIAFVLKYFPDAKIRIGGNADAKGRQGVNMDISRGRAATIKQHLVDAGVAANRISTEGFGKERAVIPATATDAERAPDRDFAMRFMK